MCQAPGLKTIGGHGTVKLQYKLVPSLVNDHVKITASDSHDTQLDPATRFVANLLFPGLDNILIQKIVEPTMTKAIGYLPKKFEIPDHPAELDLDWETLSTHFDSEISTSSSLAPVPTLVIERKYEGSAEEDACAFLDAFEKMRAK